MIFPSNITYPSDALYLFGQSQTFDFGGKYSKISVSAKNNVKVSEKKNFIVVSDTKYYVSKPNVSQLKGSPIKTISNSTKSNSISGSNNFPTLRSSK